MDLPAEELGRTRARCRYTAVARPAWLRFIIEPVAAAYFSRVVGRRLAGLKASCERQAGTGFAG
ncbi:hypothetical protein [Eleftheria terrae]|uniref:hypothetical protein n=1 Tax=Eleftheria terrae TaxID=1597781 RepID=UPI00263BABCD|nr:hypothetical protein [Eleftheria terrae]WKB54712.1 hypothetical protein N7L95_10150 [Eleftheria terrae]